MFFVSLSLSLSLSASLYLSISLDSFLTTKYPIFLQISRSRSRSNSRRRRKVKGGRGSRQRQGTASSGTSSGAGATFLTSLPEQQDRRRVGRFTRASAADRENSKHVQRLRVRRERREKASKRVSFSRLFKSLSVFAFFPFVCRYLLATSTCTETPHSSTSIPRPNAKTTSSKAGSRIRKRSVPHASDARSRWGERRFPRVLGQSNKQISRTFEPCLRRGRATCARN